jgi:hypothetical protein
MTRRDVREAQLLRLTQDPWFAELEQTAVDALLANKPLTLPERPRYAVVTRPLDDGPTTRPLDDGPTTRPVAPRAPEALSEAPPNVSTPAPTPTRQRLEDKRRAMEEAQLAAAVAESLREADLDQQMEDMRVFMATQLSLKEP